MLLIPLQETKKLQRLIYDLQKREWQKAPWWEQQWKRGRVSQCCSAHNCIRDWEEGQSPAPDLLMWSRHCHHYPFLAVWDSIIIAKKKIIQSNETSHWTEIFVPKTSDSSTLFFQTGYWRWMLYRAEETLTPFNVLFYCLCPSQMSACFLSKRP